jgi:hypothetical protein
MEWETNYCAMAKDIIMSGLTFDESYDDGRAYENQDFAIRCHITLGSNVILDSSNHAIGLPHKAYFKEIETYEMGFNNRAFHEKKWGI